MPKPPPSSGIFRLCLANRFPPWKPLGAPFTFSFHPSAVSPPRAFTLSLTAAVYFKGGTSGCRVSNDGSLWSARRAIRIFARLAPVISHLDSKMTVYASGSTGGRFARTFRFSHEEYWCVVREKGGLAVRLCGSATFSARSRRTTHSAPRPGTPTTHHLRGCSIGASKRKARVRIARARPSGGRQATARVSPVRRTVRALPSRSRGKAIRRARVARPRRRSRDANARRVPATRAPPRDSTLTLPPTHPNPADVRARTRRPKSEAARVRSRTTCPSRLETKAPPTRTGGSPPRIPICNPRARGALRSPARSKNSPCTPTRGPRRCATAPARPPAPLPFPPDRFSRVSARDRAFPSLPVHRLDTHAHPAPRLRSPRSRLTPWHRPRSPLPSPTRLGREF